MSLLFETIKCQNRKLINAQYHDIRVGKSLEALFGINRNFDFARTISIPEWVGEGIYRCRVSYSEEIEKIEFFAYQFRNHYKIRLIEFPSIQYPYKFEDRKTLQCLLQENNDVDEVIITQNGYLTDTTYSNLAFFDGEKWYTPKVKLLEGTKRAFLIENELLFEEEIHQTDLVKFKRIALINAMRDLDLNNEFELKKDLILLK